MPRKGQFTSHRIVDGQERKFCGECRQWLLLDRFHPKTEGGYYTPCKECRGKGPNPMVPFKPQVYAWLKALINRVGKAEAARTVGIAKSQVSKYMGTNPPRKVHRDTARAILSAYLAALRVDIVISKDSIRHGAFERGKAVKLAVYAKDLYDRLGDREPEYKQASRARGNL